MDGLDYLKIYLDQKELFIDEDVEDGAIDYEMTGRLLAAAFDYLETGESNIGEYFAPGTAGRMAWKSIRRHLDACKKQKVTNQQNGSERKRTEANGSDEGATTSDMKRRASESKRKQATRSERKRMEATGSDEEADESEKAQYTYINHHITDINHQSSLSSHHPSEQQEQHTQEQEQDARAPIHVERHTAAAEAAAAPVVSCLLPPRWDDVYHNATMAGIVDGKQGAPAFYSDCLQMAPDCTPEWVDAAIIQSQKQHRCTWAYMASILRGYEASGGIDTVELGQMTHRARDDPWDDLPM